MANKRVSPAKKKQAPLAETSSSIEEQTRAFLEKGGIIEKIEAGASGQEFIRGRQHIKLG
jgi:hypothetical protein